MTNENKETIENVKACFNDDEYFRSFSMRHGMYVSIESCSSREQFRSCFDDAEAHGFKYVDIEFDTNDFSEIFILMHFTAKDRRGRISLKMLKDEDTFNLFFNGVKGFIAYDLRPINADTERAIKFLYESGNDKWNDGEIQMEATLLSLRLDEIARSWIECLKWTNNDDDVQRVVGNSTEEKCEMIKWGKMLDEIINRTRE